MEKVTNLKYLREFSNNDVVFMKDMINIFIDTIGDDLRAIEDAWHKEDYALVRSTVHKMKPSYQFMGIADLREDILKLEQLSKASENPPEMKRLIRKITENTILAIKELEVDLQNL
ncbi:MAG TPA: Hpt domain-containing protein [Cytophagales bacterium]|nr:Hpt domain-containing protein [Cytophagales bacterium]